MESQNEITSTPVSWRKQNSHELLAIEGNRHGLVGKDDVIRCLMKRKRKNRFETQTTFRVVKSPLFAKLDKFLPEIKSSTEVLMNISEAERRKSVNIENVENCNEVVEMSLLLGLPVIENEADDDSELIHRNADYESHSTEANLRSRNKKLIFELDSVDKNSGIKESV